MTLINMTLITLINMTLMTLINMSLITLINMALINNQEHSKRNPLMILINDSFRIPLNDPNQSIPTESPVPTRQTKIILKGETALRTHDPNDPNHHNPNQIPWPQLITMILIDYPDYQINTMTLDNHPDSNYQMITVILLKYRERNYHNPNEQIIIMTLKETAKRP
jgi:hypothetical protein